MKQLLSLTAAAIAMMSASHSMAASSVDLSVKGSITPAACVPALSGGGVVDHGKISFKDLNRTGETALPEQTLQLAVNCDASTLFAVKVTDNRLGSSGEWNGGPSAFGLGFVNGNVAVGYYSLMMSKSMADGAPQPVIESVDGQVWFDALDDQQAWQPGWMRSFKLASGGNIAPMPVQAMQTDVRVQTMIRDKAGLPASQEIPIDGNATLDVVYL
ncbi:DUF1120 domain-containing protein [Pseudomonas kairouanensis]|uniref:DUF1120 domain-containing protein n=1 Tax=Pseudomonas kairouanensis TaxID=2293832 RepID=A0A4Z0B2T2_9PSED|nr:DUF1120 domain-containing protein [Pseudomonas kairouanensis]TFY92634.1 DUF1120 domain-containing protein [Pseudomonas kairouanensis]